MPPSELMSELVPQFRPADPPNFLTQERFRPPFQLAAEKVQLHRAFRVLVRDLEQFCADNSLAAKLFTQLADETAFVGFAVFALAARKLPHAFQVRPAEPSRDQIGADSFDYRSRDNDPCVSHVRCRG